MLTEKDWISAGAFPRARLHRDDHLCWANTGVSQRSDACSDALAQLGHRNRARSDHIMQRDVKQARHLVGNERGLDLGSRPHLWHVDPLIVRNGVASSA